MMVATMVAMLLVPAPARAAEAPTAPAAHADELIKQGFQLRLQGKNLEALDLFNKAHQVAPSAKTLGQIGSVEVALHRWLEAEAHLTDALARHDSPWVESPKNRGMLEKTLQEARKQIGRVRVTGTPGAEVFADGKRLGALPLTEPVHAVAGTVQMRATALGRQTAEKQVIVRGGEETSVALDLLPAGSIGELPSIPIMPEETSAPAVLVGAAPAPAPMPTWRKWSGRALVAAGAAAIGVGIGWVIVDGRPNCDAPPGAVCRHLHDTKTQGWIAIAAGGAAAGAGATLLLWPAKERTTAIVIAPGGIGLAGRF
jgi:hypothetical protein